MFSVLVTQCLSRQLQKEARYHLVWKGSTVWCRGWLEPRRKLREPSRISRTRPSAQNVGLTRWSMSGVTGRIPTGRTTLEHKPPVPTRNATTSVREALLAVWWCGAKNPKMCLHIGSRARTIQKCLGVQLLVHRRIMSSRFRAQTSVCLSGTLCSSSVRRRRCGHSPRPCLLSGIHLRMACGLRQVFHRESWILPRCMAQS